MQIIKGKTDDIIGAERVRWRFYRRSDKRDVKQLFFRSSFIFNLFKNFLIIIFRYTKKNKLKKKLNNKKLNNKN